MSEQEYYELIYRKTACLFRVSMQLGCVLGDGSEQTQELLGEYGRNLGLAFQIVDDVLDLTASEEVLGKPMASDLREGKATLAVVHALQSGTPEERADILAIIGDQSFERVSHKRILFRSCTAMDRSTMQCGRHTSMPKPREKSFPFCRSRNSSGRCYGCRISLSRGRNSCSDPGGLGYRSFGSCSAFVFQSLPYK